MGGSHFTKLVTGAAKAELFPAGTIESFYSRDFDEVASLPPLWEQQYSQIRPGAYEGRLFMAMTGSLVVALESSSVGLMIRGCIPPDSAMIAIPFRCAGTSVFRGDRISRHAAVVVFSGEVLDFRSLLPFDVFILVAERNLIERHAQRVLGRPLASLRRNAQVSIHQPDQVEHRLRALVADLSARKEQIATALRDPASAETFERDVCDVVLSGLAPRRAENHRTACAELAWLAEQYLRAHMGQQISIRDLCQVTGAPERTLHLAFRQHIGSTPKAYLKTLRLNAVRRDLRAAKTGATVTELALRWGFTHLGRFSHDYKTMFGGMLRKTLQERASRLRSVAEI